MRHEILGEITQPADDIYDGIATILYGGRQIKIYMSRDDQSFMTTVELAAEVAKRLAELDETARRVAVTDLREKYNDGWNEFDEVQEDGSLKSVSHPQLSETEFETNLTLNEVIVTGDRMIRLAYHDGGMFWGHGIEVCSLNGTDFAEAHAELFG